MGSYLLYLIVINSEYISVSYISDQVTALLFTIMVLCADYKQVPLKVETKHADKF
jgi:hypothetical protein